MGEPLPPIGDFVVAQIVPEFLSEEATPQEHWGGEIKQAPEVVVLMNGQGKPVLTKLAL